MGGYDLHKGVPPKPGTWDSAASEEEPMFLSPLGLGVCLHLEKTVEGGMM